MASTGPYKAVIIGAGQAGIPLARSLAQAGWRTALVEREHVGGTCYNEREAHEKELDVRVVTIPMDHVARALEVDESRGFLKAIVDRATDLIVGFAR